MESGANLAIAASDDVRRVKAQVSRFSKFPNLLFISLNNTTSWAEKLGVCDRGPSVLLVLCLPVFTSGMLLKTT